MLDFPLPGLIRIIIRTCSYLLRFVRHVSAKTWCGIVFAFPNGTRSTYHWFFRGNGWLSHWMSDWVFPIATLSLITNPMPPLRKQHIKQPKSDPEMNGSLLNRGSCLVVTGTLYIFHHFSIYWECHHPNWLIFFRVETTNQEGIAVPIESDLEWHHRSRLRCSLFERPAEHGHPPLQTSLSLRGQRLGRPKHWGFQQEIKHGWKTWG